MEEFNDALLDFQGRIYVPQPTSFESLVEIYPWLTFWYGISPGELATIQNEVKFLYARSLPQLISQYHWIHITAALYPWLNEKGRQQVGEMFETSESRDSDKPSTSRAAFREEPRPQTPTMAKEEYLSSLTYVGIQIVDETENLGPRTAEATT